MTIANDSQVQKVGDGKSPQRIRASTDQMADILNSLLLQGYIERTGPASFKLTAGGNPLTTKGDIFTFGTADARLPVGADGDVLTANSSATLGVDWESPSAGGGNDPISSVYPIFTPTGSSDEFSAGTFPTGWTAVNSGSHTVVATNTNNVLSLAHPGGDGSGELHAWMKTPTITSGSFVEIAFRAIGFSQNFNDCGVLFADGTTYGSGAQAVFWDSMQDHVWGLAAWTDYNTQGSTSTQAYDQSTPHSDVFLRLVYNGSNSFTGLVSCDGISWITALTKTITLTPTVAGFWVSTAGGAGPCLFSLRYAKYG